ncbi:phospholipase D-like domain-containing protein [Rubripirellula obstinata]|uniref:phospholipase D-like domain-containing protein n=1 Tax=Rubripirellula obstinata TaxID=406547 RepID=UPI003B836ED3
MELATYRGEPTFRAGSDLPGVCGERLIKAIRSVKKTIQIASAHFRRFDMHDELLAAMARGVSVRIMLDQRKRSAELFTG